MKRTLFGAAAISGAAIASSGIAQFDTDVVGKAPAGWTCGATGTGAPRWTVEADPTAPKRPNVLKQSGAATFPWCVKDDTQASDDTVEVKFSSLAGKEDQAGGVVWRWKNSDNYYVARANALENNVSLYYTQDGARKTIDYKDAPVAPNVWHTLRVTFKETAIEVALDGKVYIDAQDTHISGTGKMGVWTKADSVTVFDDFTYTSADK